MSERKREREKPRWGNEKESRRKREPRYVFVSLYAVQKLP